MELIPTFIKRKHGEETITYLHPVMENILSNTYGVIVYQEQVMDMATQLAGLTRGEGYLLIKAVGKKIKSLLDEQKVKFINGCLKNNIPGATAERTWGLIEPFARYGFNKAHSACYATIAYRTAYLKANYPEESMAALLNNEMSDIERISFLIQEARQNKLDILPPDINMSFVNFTPEGRDKIRFGLLGVKNVGEEITKGIIEERSMRGPFKNFDDFISRVRHKDLNKKSLESLAKAGAFDSFGLTRNQVLENMEEILRFNSIVKRSASTSQVNSLFGAMAPTVSIKLKPVPEVAESVKLTWEKELLGFYLSNHPLNTFSEQLKGVHTRSIAELLTMRNEEMIYRTAALVSQIKKITTKNGKPMMFVTIEDLSPKPMEVIVFTRTMEKTLPAWQENGVVVIEGRMSWRGGEPKMICETAKLLTA